MKGFVIFLSVFLSLVNFVITSNILAIFSKPSYSHQSVFRGLTEKLLENGHKLTLMSTHPSDNEKNHKNVTLIDVSFTEKMFEKRLNDVFEKKSKGWKNVYYFINDNEAFIVSEQLKSEGMQKLLKDKSAKFDLLLIEIGGYSPFHALAERFQIPVVGITSADTYSVGHEVMGNVVNPIVHPERSLPFKMAKTFEHRIISCLFMLFLKFFIVPRAVQNYEKIVKEHFPEVTKNFHELISNVDLLLVNAHPALGFIRPILPNTIQLGFLHIKPPKQLPEDLQTLLDSSKHGVIYMSFGTLIKPNFYNKNSTNFLEAFSDVPYDILWKYEGENFSSTPSHVHIRKWFPQSDLLAHPKVKLFITHGGLHSLEESIMRHVPMIVCPFHGDQAANAERAVERGIAKALNIHEKLDAGQIKNAINEVITDGSFKANIEMLAKLVDDVPMKSPEKAVWYIENVIRNKGAKHLRYPQKEIPFYQYHFYDLILSVLCLIALLSLIIYGLVKLIVKCVKSAMNLKSKKD